MLPVTIYQQINDYTCGPAALLTAISHFAQIPNVNEQQLVELMKTNDAVGTANDAMVRGAKALGFFADSKSESSLAEVETELAKDRPVIVVYNDAEYGYHFAVVVAVDDEAVTLADPWSKKHLRLARKDFEDRWSSSEGERGWWLSIAPQSLKSKVGARYDVKNQARRC